MEIDVTAFFSIDGVPATGLEPLVRAHNATKQTHIRQRPMVELGDGHYTCKIDIVDPYDIIVWTIDGGGVLPDQSRYKRGYWQVTRRFSM